jgi:nitrogenase-stabilizing/protective protein
MAQNDLDWFSQLEGVDELASAQEFMEFFQLEYDVTQLLSKHLHVMHEFHHRLTLAIPLITSDSDPQQQYWQLAQRILHESYLQVISGPLASRSGLAVYQRSNRTFTPWDALWEVTI